MQQAHRAYVRPGSLGCLRHAAGLQGRRHVRGELAVDLGVREHATPGCGDLHVRDEHTALTGLLGAQRDVEIVEDTVLLEQVWPDLFQVSRRIAMFAPKSDETSPPLRSAFDIATVTRRRWIHCNGMSYWSKKPVPAPTVGSAVAKKSRTAAAQPGLARVSASRRPMMSLWTASNPAFRAAMTPRFVSLMSRNRGIRSQNEAAIAAVSSVELLSTTMISSSSSSSVSSELNNQPMVSASL